MKTLAPTIWPVGQRKGIVVNLKLLFVFKRILIVNL